MQKRPNIKKWSDFKKKPNLKKRPNFKKREDFGSEEDYKGYVMARIKPNMVVSSNNSRVYWRDPSRKWNAHVKEGHVGFVLKTDSSASVAVKWLTIPESGDSASILFGAQECTGPYECLDLLTNPVQCDNPTFF